MTEKDESLPANVLEAMRQGSTLEAVKLLCESTGLGLKESRDIIYQHLQAPPGAVVEPASFNHLPASVVSALQRGDKMEAVRLLRAQTGLGLQQAKDAVEGEPWCATEVNQHIPTVERPRSSRRMWWLSGLLLAGYAAYYFLQNPG